MSFFVCVLAPGVSRPTPVQAHVIGLASNAFDRLLDEIELSGRNARKSRLAINRARARATKAFFAFGHNQQPKVSIDFAGYQHRLEPILSETKQ
jgi:hypothetical protein